jgi:hypothetical protein
LSAAAGTPIITVTATGNVVDIGFTASEYSSSGDTWSVDSALSNGSVFDDKGLGGTTSARTNAWSTAGANDLILMAYMDEATTQATHTPTTSFSEVQWDNGHVDGQAEWLGAGAQTSVTSGWNIATSCNTWALYVAAFTATAPARKFFLLTNVRRP